MAKGINRVTLVGHVGQQPKITRKDDFIVAKLSLATGDVWKDKVTGEKRETTEWHNLVFFGKLAEIIEKWVNKGDQLYVEGKLKTHRWEKDGIERFSTEIVGSEIQMCGGGRSERKEEDHDQSYPGTYKAEYIPQSPSNLEPGTSNQFDDDIPF